MGFSDLDGRESIIIKTLSLAKKVGKWPNFELSFVGKIKYLIRENIEITCDGIVFRSPKYVITDEPLLNGHEQKIFNESISFARQVQVLTGIVLVQTTFGPQFVT